MTNPAPTRQRKTNQRLTMPPPNRPEERESFLQTVGRLYGEAAQARADGARAQADMERGIVAGMPEGVASGVRGLGAMAGAGAGIVGVHTNAQGLVSPIDRALSGLGGFIAGANPNSSVEMGRAFGRQVPGAVAGMAGGPVGMGASIALGAGQSADSTMRDLQAKGRPRSWGDNVRIVESGTLGGFAAKLKPETAARVAGRVAGSALKNVAPTVSGQISRAAAQAPPVVRRVAERVGHGTSAGAIGATQQFVQNLIEEWTDPRGRPKRRDNPLGAGAMGAGLYGVDLMRNRSARR